MTSFSFTTRNPSMLQENRGRCELVTHETSGSLSAVRPSAPPQGQ